MRVISGPYVGHTFKHSKKFLRKLKKGSELKNAYVITLAPGKDLLEIYECSVLNQPYYRQRFERPVIGIAADYDEAVQLVITITQECLEQKGNCNLKEFLWEREAGK